MFRSLSALALAAAVLVGGAGRGNATTLFSENFSGATPGGYSGAIPGAQFTVTTDNVDVIGVLNGSFFTCVDNPSGNCLDLVGNSGGGAITSTVGLNLTAGQTYAVAFGSNLQGYSTTDTAQTTFDVQLGTQISLEALTAAEGDHAFVVDFTPTTDETGALLSFTTLTAPDSVHGAVLDNITVTTPSVSAAPEPATWLLMIVGLGGVGLALRRAKPGLSRAFA